MGNDGLICVHKVNFTWNEYQAEQQAIFQVFFSDEWLGNLQQRMWDFHCNKYSFDSWVKYEFKQRKERSDKISGFQAFS